jgi:hypothetical protein
MRRAPTADAMGQAAHRSSLTTPIGLAAEFPMIHNPADNAPHGGGSGDACHSIAFVIAVCWMRHPAIAPSAGRQETACWHVRREDTRVHGAAAGALLSREHCCLAVQFWQWLCSQQWNGERERIWQQYSRDRLGDTTSRFCTVNIVMANRAVQSVNYKGPTGGLLTEAEQCAFAIRACLPQ